MNNMNIEEVKTGCEVMSENEAQFKIAQILTMLANSGKMTTSIHIKWHEMDDDSCIPHSISFTEEVTID